MLKRLEIAGFKSFAKKTVFAFDTPITAIVGPNGSGKSNVAESLKWVLGEQSMKSLRGKRGEDLIWNGSKSVARGNRASVTLVFDNSNRTFNVDFDEVAISREVHRDGVNEYLINGSKVRLRDVYELLSAVSLGASSHHIINQGEADRILHTSTKERRGMIEDALGLKIFQYKKEEAEKKLEKTKENIKEAESLRREIAPHLKFLKKQVEQIQKAATMRDELKVLYQEYFSIENAILIKEKDQILPEKKRLQEELKTIEASLGKVEALVSGGDDTEQQKLRELREAEQRLDILRREKDNLVRSLGRLEGKLEARPTHQTYVEEVDSGEKRCRYCKQVIREENANHSVEAEWEQMMSRVRAEKEEVEKTINAIGKEETDITTKIQALKSALDAFLAESRNAERSLFDIKTRRNSLIGALERLKLSEENLLVREADYMREMGEAGILVGREVSNLTSPAEGIIGAPETRTLQDERRRRIEKMKVRLEDLGAGGEDVMKEHDETQKRDEFLAREIEDLHKSAESINQLMVDLTVTLENKFKEGLDKINKEFTEFFSVLFGGGRASLTIVREQRRRVSVADMLEDEGSVIEQSTQEGEEEWGIGVDVDLPRKKIRGLDMLSGGERALTSIALLFAMSQVNPPPFLVLDETDAALDEANSRKYGDMIVNLSKKSQLIVITHNRETMSRAHVLYGVTMSADSVSQVLSVRFDEAAAFAK